MQCAAIRIEFSPRELLAKGIWPTDVTQYVPADINPTLDIHAMDYNNLVITIAVESDQAVRVVAYRKGLKSSDDSQVRRTMRIVNRNLNLHAVWSNTIVGVTLPSTGSSGVPIPYRITDSHVTLVPGSTTDGISFLRNDYGLADLICQQAAGFAFRPRRAISLVLLQPSIAPAVIPWLTLGSLIIATSDSNGISTTVGTVVEQVKRTYGKSPRLQILTTLPPMPNFANRGNVSASPISGGSVSTSMGATPTQAIQAIREDVVDLQQKSSRIPIFTQVPLQPSALQIVQIIVVQTIDGVPIIQYAADPITAPSAYDPAVDVTYAAGLGNGWLYNQNGQQLQQVLVRHNYIGFTDPVMGGVSYYVGYPVQVAVTGGGTITCYPIVRG